MKKLFLLGSLCIIASAAKAQTSTGIGTIIPDANAILDVNSNAKGVLIPRLSISDRTTNIPTPTEGLMVYQTDGVTGLYIYNNGAWKRMVTNTETQRYSLGGTGSVALTAALPGAYYINGLTQSLTLATSSTVTLSATVGAINASTAVAGQYSTVDVILYIDGLTATGSAGIGSVYNRFTVANPGSIAANGSASTTLSTSFPLSAGAHTIAIGCYRAGGNAPSVNVGGAAATSAIPASMVIQVIPN